jgi:hypothetical protein
VSFAAIALSVASQLVFIVVSVYFVIDSVQKLLNKSSYHYPYVTEDAFQLLTFKL